MIVIKCICLALIGFLCLIKGASWFVDGASSLAKKLKIPSIIIGLTIVAIGTSIPETFISVTASINNNNDISLGNVLGSNILNILIILGVSSLLLTLTVSKKMKLIDIPFMIGITILVSIFAYTDSQIVVFEGIILLLLFILYLAYLCVSSIKEKNSHSEETEKNLSGLRTVLYLIVGLALIIAGSQLVVTYASELAVYLNLSQRFISLTIVSFGTSLPELVTSVSASLKKKNDIAIGNIIGSNIYNILAIIGIASLIAPIQFNSGFMIDSLIAVFSAVLLLVCLLIFKKLNKVTGILMLTSYAGYLTFLFLK